MGYSNSDNPEYERVLFSARHGGPVKDPTSLDEYLPAVEDAVSELSFTPVIGPDCSVIDRKSTARWQTELAPEFQWLLNDTEHLRLVERSYAQSLFDEKDLPSVVQARRPSAELHNFRLQLVELGAKAGAVFGARMATSVDPVTNVGGHKVQVQDASDIAALEEHLLNTTASAWAVYSSAQNTVAQTRWDNVYKRLVELTKAITGGFVSDTVRRTTSESAARIIRELGLETRHPTQPLDLRFRQLRWVADLLWYTFRHNSCTYLTADELAFQVSLGVQGADTKPEPPQSFEAQGYSLIGDRLPDWQDLCPHDACTSEAQVTFYDAVAKVLIRQRARWEATEAQPRHGETNWAIEPIAISVNLDNELEKALTRARSPFSVVVPVRVKRVIRWYRRGPKPPAEYHFKWVIGSIDEDGRANKWDWFNARELKPKEVQGPIILKLHGSPFHQGEIAAQEHLRTEDFAEIEPALTVSESDYFYYVLSLKGSLPDAFKAALVHPGRAVFFLGLPLQEWNYRLRVFEHVYPDLAGPATAEEQRPYLMAAIGKFGDAVRSSVLKSLNVQRWDGPVEAIVPAILDGLRRSETQTGGARK